MPYLTRTTMLGNCWVTVSRLDPAKHWFPGPTGEWANGGPPSNAASVRGAVRSVRTSAGASSSPPTGAWPDAGWASPAHSSRPNRSAARSAERRTPGGVSSSPWLYIQLEALQDIPFHLHPGPSPPRGSQNRCLRSMWGRLSNTVTASTFERFVATRTKCGCLRASARGQPNQHTRVQSVPIERGGSPKHPSRGQASLAYLAFAPS